MVAYVVYDKNTGEILRKGTCPDSMLEIQASGPNQVARDVPTCDGINDIFHRMNLKDGTLEDIPNRGEDLLRLDKAIKDQQKERIKELRRLIKEDPDALLELLVEQGVIS